MLSLKYNENDKSSVLALAKELVGKRLSEVLNLKLLDEINNLKGNKGGFGQIIEKYIFGKNPNSSPEPDFLCGTDCKVTPLYIKKTDGQLSPKERLVCNIINYNTIIHETWDSSSFMKKNGQNLIIRYIDPKNSSIKKTDYLIVDALIFDLKKSIYYKQFEDDWLNIINTIKKGNAENLSEGHTQWLGACTKGANKNSLRSQPNSKILAMQRAFSFKGQFMSELLKKYPIDKVLYRF